MSAADSEPRRDSPQAPALVVKPCRVRHGFGQVGDERADLAGSVAPKGRGVHDRPVAALVAGEGLRLQARVGCGPGAAGLPGPSGRDPEVWPAGNVSPDGPDPGVGGESAGTSGGAPLSQRRRPRGSQRELPQTPVPVTHTALVTPRSGEAAARSCGGGRSGQVTPRRVSDPMAPGVGQGRVVPCSSYPRLAPRAPAQCRPLPGVWCSAGDGSVRAASRRGVEGGAETTPGAGAPSRTTAGSVKPAGLLPPLAASSGG